MPDFSAQQLIQQVVNSTNQSNQTLGQGAADLGLITQKMQDLLTTGQAEMAGAVVDAQKVAGQTAAIDYARNSMLQGIQRLYNMDPEQANFAVAKEMAAYDSARTERLAVRSEYNKLAQVDLMTNPLGWIVAQTALPQVAAQNNALADAEDEALQDIRVRNELLGATKNTIIANTADAIQANQLDAAAAKARMGQAELSTQEAKNLAMVSSSKLQQTQLLEQQNDNTRQAVGVIASIKNAEETRAMRREAREDGAAMRSLQQLMLEEKKGELDSKKAERDMFNGRLTEVSNSLGHKVPMTIDRLKTLPEKERAAWLQAAQASGFGTTLDDATQFFLSKNNLQSTEIASVQSTAQKLEEAGKSFAPQARARAQVPGPDGKTGKVTDEQLRNMAFNDYTTAQVSAMYDRKATEDLSAKRWDKTYNAYVAPFTSFSKAIDTQPSLDFLKNNMVKKQIDLLQQAGVIRGDNLTADQQQQVLLAVQQQVLEKKILPKQAAADITNFLKGAAAFNLSLNKYTLFALPVQQNYQFTLEGGGGKTDLFDPAAVENTLMRGIKARTSATNIYNPMMFR